MNKYLFVKNIYFLIENHYFPKSSDSDILSLDIDDYDNFINYLENAGILIISSYDNLWRFKDKKYKTKISLYFSDRKYEFPNNNIYEIRFKKVSFDMHETQKDFFEINTYLNWHTYDRYTCIIKTKYILQELDSWVFINENKYSEHKNYLITKKDVEEYRSTWGESELDLLLSTYNKLSNYPILVSYVINKINISSLKILESAINSIKSLDNIKYEDIIGTLENYYSSIYPFSYDIEGFLEYKSYRELIEFNRVFKKEDFQFINEISNIINSKTKAIYLFYKVKHKLKKINQLIDKFKETISS